MESLRLYSELQIKTWPPEPLVRDPNARSLQALPTGLLLEYIKYTTDFPSLNGLLTLLTAHNRGVSFVEDFQSFRQISLRMLSEQVRGQELSRDIVAVVTFRNHSPTRRVLLAKVSGKTWARGELSIQIPSVRGQRTRQKAPLPAVLL